MNYMENKQYLPHVTRHLQQTMSTPERIKDIIQQRQNESARHFDSPFFIADMNIVKQQYITLKEMIPRVHIYYAMKACSDHPVLNTFARIGASFDCASEREIDTILKLGVDTSRIIFANTVKFPSCLQFAADNNISLMTFDNEDELMKIKQFHPQARLLLRIRCEDSVSVAHSFGMKFGCSLENAAHLLQRARSLQVLVVGVSFHVGSGAGEPFLFRRAIEDAQTVFHMGKSTGFNFSILDIGGGLFRYTESDPTLKLVTDEINVCLDQYFPTDTGVQIIAEPGQLLVSSAYTWVLQVIGKRSNETAKEGMVYDRWQQRTVAPRFLYYVNDGLFGSMPLLTASMPLPKLLNEKDLNTTATYSSVIFGPTCASYDVLYHDITLPELFIGDRLYLENAGAYSRAVATDFNMMPRAQCYYISEEE